MYFIHKTTGKLVYDFGKGTKLYEPWWLLVLCDKEIINYYAKLCVDAGILLQKGSAYGAHVSVTRGEIPPNIEKWGKYDNEEIELFHSHNVRWSKYHAWIDVYSERLNEIREELGYPLKPQKILSDGRILSQSFHISIGRINY